MLGTQCILQGSRYARDLCNWIYSSGIYNINPSALQIDHMFSTHISFRKSSAQFILPSAQSNHRRLGTKNSPFQNLFRFFAEGWKKMMFFVCLEQAELVLVLLNCVSTIINIHQPLRTRNTRPRSTILASKPC